MTSTIKIEWLTKSLSMYDFLEGSSEISVRGGRLYEIQAIELLKKSYKISLNPYYVKRNNFFEYVLFNHKSKIQGDICVLDPYIIALGKFDSKRKNIAIIHHIDEKSLGNVIVSKLFYNNLFRNLKKMDAVVTVSEVWKNELESKGVKNIKVIYNAFDTSKYVFSEAERMIFKERYGFTTGKPLIYIGPNSRGKGVDEVLNVIKGDYHLVVTGNTKHPNPMVKTHFFEDDEFRLFLASCDLVLCMSTMPEGWNRIAHEALLAKTPVIGSGSGGMMELLEKGGQPIVTDLDNLNKVVEAVLLNPDYYKKTGFTFASKYDLTYFTANWNSLINALL